MGRRIFPSESRTQAGAAKSLLVLPVEGDGKKELLFFLLDFDG